jgi:hypothetical protein
MEDKINNVRLSFACDQDWNKMTPDADGRFCNGCQKKVYDLTNKKVAYFVKIMEENNGNVCGHFNADQMLPLAPVYKPRWKTWVVAAIVFIGLGTMGQKANAQKVTSLGMPVPRVVEPDCEIRTLTGIVLPSPGLNDKDKKKLQKYMLRNCHLHKLVNRAFVFSFNVDKNGDVFNASVGGDFPLGAQPKILKAFKDGMKLVSHNLKCNYLHQIGASFKKGRVVALRSL